jgi:GT2 family glycosyltransferase
MTSVGGGEASRVFTYGADPGELGHGANFAVRREALYEIGGFDEALGVGVRLAGAEDHDAFWRMLRAGWTGCYEPRARVTHCQWRTRRQYLRSQWGYGLGTGAFAVKAVRLDRQPGLRILRDSLWRRGALAAARDLAKGYETGVAANTVRFGGSVVGAVRGWRMPLDGSRFVAS